MKFRTSVILVLVTGAIFAAALGAVIVAGRLLQVVQRGITGETARRQFVSEWRRPPTLTGAFLAPGHVLGWQADLPDDRIRLPSLSLEAAGVQCVYRHGDKPAITVVVLETATAKREDIVGRVRSSVQADTGVTTVIQVDDRWRFTRGQPPVTWEIWDVQGWTFVFESPGELPAEFIRAYLASVSASGGGTDGRATKESTPP